MNNTDVMCSGLFGAVTNSTIKDLAVYGTVTNNNISCSWVGGIVGAQNSGTIENCMFYGRTKAEVDNDNTSVGGIVGYSSNGTIENCIHAGGEITSSLYAGGISGFAYMTKIIKCYNDSTVISLREQTGSATERYSYGVGYVSNSQFMENSYCRSNCTVKGNNEDIEVSDLKNITSYPGLDFSKIWGMGENHPLLQILSSLT